MPAINVARTDTFEQQRVKINQISDTLFSVTSGGSDLSTGNLRLGDGTRIAPSLAFSSDTSLGVYKPASGTFGYVSSGAKLIDFSLISVTSYKDLIIQRNVLTDSGTSIIANGTNYDAGTFSGVPLLGGTGTGGTADFQVIAHNGVYNLGVNYTPGSYSDIPLDGGNGSNASIAFEVEDLEGSILSAGSAYIPGIYGSVPLTGGSGTNATADITIDGDTVTGISVTNPGSGYTGGVYSSTSLLNTPTATYVVTVVSNPGTPPPDNIYQLNGSNQPTISLIKGNTYRFDISDASTSGHPIEFYDSQGLILSAPEFQITRYGTEGLAGSFVEIVVAANVANQTIEYDCSIHDGMGGSANITTGPAGVSGFGLLADIEIDVSSQQVTVVTVTTSGTNYKVGDTFEVDPNNIGGTGSGAAFTLSSISYTGVVTGCTPTFAGQDYVNGDILGINDADVGGGGGSGFQFSVSSNPGRIDNLTWIDRGTNYQVGDVLTLPTAASNVSASLNGTVSDLSTTLSTGSNQITLTSTAGILAGMRVTQDLADPGQLASGTLVQSVDNATTLTLDLTPTSSGAATLTFESFDSTTDMNVSSVAGIIVGDLVTKVSGDGVLDANTTVSSIDDTNLVVSISSPALAPGNIVVSFERAFGTPTTPFSYTIDNLGEIESITISDGGNGYSIDDILTVDPSTLTTDIEYTVYSKQLQELDFTSTYPDGTWSVGDQLKKKDGLLTQISLLDLTNYSISPTVIGPLSTTLSTASTQITVSSTTGIVAGMFVTQEPGDVGFISPDTTVVSVDSGTVLTLSSAPSGDGAANLSFTEDLTASYTAVSFTSSGSGIGGTLDITRDDTGAITGAAINDAGYRHATGDVLTIAGGDIGGSTPANNITINVDAVSAESATVIWAINSSGGNITSILVESRAFVAGEELFDEPLPGSPTTYTINTAGTDVERLFIDTDGTGEVIHPNLNLYVGNNYNFNLSDSSMSGKTFGFSEFRDGVHSPSLISSISTTLSSSTAQINVADTTGILAGMSINIESGTGVLESGTVVQSVDNATTLTLSSTPVTAGPVILTFVGIEYSEGISRLSSSLRFEVSDQTPATLYYYVSEVENIAGVDNQEATVTIDPNNPKTFGSGFQAQVIDLDSTDVITLDIETGGITSLALSTGSIDCTTVNSTSSVTTALVDATSINTRSINAPSGVTSIDYTADNNTFSGSISVGNGILFNASSAQILTSGELKTTGSLIVDDITTIDANVISTSSANDLVLQPDTNRVVKVNATTALNIPVGDTNARPSIGIVSDGSIRFNTDTNQYEGYSSTAGAWTSLGGVRDLDGNTYILAEESIGSNDNTLWFINDNINTVKFTPTHLEFVNQKSIRSSNINAPAYTNWVANAPVSLGDYLKYKNNLYEVTLAGVTGTSGSEPTHTTGTLSNGSAELTFWGLAVGPLTFEDIEEFRIGPLGGLDLVINSELRLSQNTISTDVSDLILRPNSGKKVVIDTTSTLAIPAGSELDRGSAIQGSIRFNTTASQFEGYDGTNWGSLGGVKDVDQNTYIIPETSPGANENVLYFYNDNNNTLQLTTLALDFYSVDTIRSQISAEFEITASLMTFNNAETTLDNTAVDKTFLHTSKQYFDLGLSAGVTVDPVLRLDDQGDVYFNTGFGTGVFTGVKVFDGDLKEFELADVKILTEKISLVKGTTNTGNSIIYETATNLGSKTIVVAENPTSGDKEFIEFGIIDNGTDVFHTEYGNSRTGVQLIIPTFEVTPQNEVRLNIELGANVNPTETVNITFVSNVTKK